MSKDLNEISQRVMKGIRSGELKMRSRLYFVIGSILVFIGLVVTTITSVFLVGLIRFSWRSHGPMAEIRFNQLASSFPWWAVILALVGLFFGVWLLRRYDFSYKHSFKVIIIIFILGVFACGWLIDVWGVNEIFYQRRGWRRIYCQENCPDRPLINSGSGPGRHWRY